MAVNGIVSGQELQPVGRDIAIRMFGQELDANQWGWVAHR
jgi:hypothetical protein